MSDILISQEHANEIERLMADVVRLRAENLRLRAAVNAYIMAVAGLEETEPCFYEARTADGSMFGVARAWCRTHGFNCPNLGIQLIAKDTP
jgi:hypothetical protein